MGGLYVAFTCVTIGVHRILSLCYIGLSYHIHTDPADDTRQTPTPANLSASFPIWLAPRSSARPPCPPVRVDVNPIKPERALHITPEKDIIMLSTATKAAAKVTKELAEHDIVSEVRDAKHRL